MARVHQMHFMQEWHGVYVELFLAVTGEFGDLVTVSSRLVGSSTARTSLCRKYTKIEQAAGRERGASPKSTALLAADMWTTGLTLVSSAGSNHRKRGVACAGEILFICPQTTHYVPLPSSWSLSTYRVTRRLRRTLEAKEATTKGMIMYDPLSSPFSASSLLILAIFNFASLSSTTVVILSR
ncbi:hypothetical protein RJZ56_006131 [Blastomyces dermatitidis]